MAMLPLWVVTNPASSLASAEIVTVCSGRFASVRLPDHPLTLLSDARVWLVACAAPGSRYLAVTVRRATRPPTPRASVAVTSMGKLPADVATQVLGDTTRGAGGVRSRPTKEPP